MSPSLPPLDPLQYSTNWVKWEKANCPVEIGNIYRTDPSTQWECSEVMRTDDWWTIEMSILINSLSSPSFSSN
jgi:hypothetical protein